jgi:endoglucanase
MVFFLTLVSCQPKDDESPAYIPSNPATVMVRDMGIGINIGNALDSINNRPSDTPAGETGWGNPLISIEYIKALKNYGFKTIRLPVTWAEYLGPAPDYAIASERMDRVEEVVKWILEEGMYCILNLHHDGGESPKSWILGFENDEEVIGDKFVKVWRQIAGRFAGYPNELILEAMNEVGFNNSIKTERYRKMNKLNQLFVDTVRASGSGNQTRFLLISGLWTDINQTVDPLFLMPQDTVKDRQIISVHYYTPPQFCIAGSTNSSFGYKFDWGIGSKGESEYQALKRQFDKLVDRFSWAGIPVIIGEYNVTRSNKDEDSRVRWLTAVTRTCLDNGMCPVIWDNGTGGEIYRVPPYEMRSPFERVWQNLEILP